MNTLTFEEIARLSPPERLALIGDLWDSLSDAELPVARAQRIELERRLDSFERDRASSVTRACHSRAVTRSLIIMPAAQVRNHRAARLV